MGYCLNTTLRSFSNFLRALSTFTRAAAQDGHWKSPNSTSTVLADRFPFDHPSGVITGLSDKATFEEAAIGELSGALRLTKNMATATAATTSTAKAVSGLARERFVDSCRLELDF